MREQQLKSLKKKAKQLGVAVIETPTTAAAAPMATAT
jgi:hypothetical protein